MLVCLFCSDTSLCVARWVVRSSQAWAACEHRYTPPRAAIPSLLWIANQAWQAAPSPFLKCRGQAAQPVLSFQPWLCLFWPWCAWLLNLDTAFMLALHRDRVVFYSAASVVWHMSYVTIKYQHAKTSWSMRSFSPRAGVRMAQKWWHEGEAGSKPKKKVGRETLCQGFPWSRRTEFREGVSYLI